MSYWADGDLAPASSATRTYAPKAYLVPYYPSKPTPPNRTILGLLNGTAPKVSNQMSYLPNKLVAEYVPSSNTPPAQPNLPPLANPVVWNIDPLYVPVLGAPVSDASGGVLVGRSPKALITNMSPIGGVPVAPGYYGFYFHYNPTQIGLSMSIDYDAAQNQGVDPTSANVLGKYGTVSFQTIINRQDEVANGTYFNAGEPILTSNNFRDLGTLYDLEILYRVMNGPPNPLTQNPDTGTYGYSPLPNSSFVGYLYGAACKIKFAPNLVFVGRVTEIDVTHVMFSPNMVPTITEITLSLTNTMVPSEDGGGGLNPVNGGNGLAPGYSYSYGPGGVTTITTPGGNKLT